MDRHVFVETNFLYQIAHMPHRQLPAQDLWRRFEARELEIHVPFVCFQEARAKIASSLGHNPIDEVVELRRYLRDVVGARWDDGALAAFFAQAESYRMHERSPGVRDKRFREVRALLESSGSVIHGEDGIFSSIPVSIDHELKYNDHLILASVCYRAMQLKQASGACELFFCSTDVGDLRPRDNRAKLSRLYSDLGIEFRSDFDVP